MSDTIRTRAALLALLADNVAGDISAQDMRDLLVSLHGVYGMLYVASGASAQSLTTTPAKLTGFAANGPSAGTTPAHGSDQITVGTDGVYLIMGQFSCIGETGATYRLALRVGGVEAPEIATKFTASMTVGDHVSASFVGLVSLSGSDVLTVYGESDDAGGADLTPVEAQVMVKRVA
jgi:hypothetical protein